MKYHVKEIFYSLQGEGFHTGRPALFCRFTGCNLWSGLEKDRKNALCRFCDTDIRNTDGPGGGVFQSAEVLADKLFSLWPQTGGKEIPPYIVFTGGEPLLQLDERLIGEIHSRSGIIAVETNGTIEAPEGIDWICVSPKAGVDLKQKCGDEVKFVYPQEGLSPEELEKLDFRHYYLQPLDGADRKYNTEKAVEYCLKNPRWQLSLQTHKYLGIP